MRKREMKAALRNLRNNPENLSYDSDSGTIVGSVYLGSYLSLDPCGRYHHILSPNGVTSRCIRYWENLDEAAMEIGGSIESGDGDGVYYTFVVTDSAEQVEINGDPVYVDLQGGIYYGDPSDLSYAPNIVDYLL